MYREGNTIVMYRKGNAIVIYGSFVKFSLHS